MSTNRVLQFLSRECPSCSQLRRIERQLERCAVDAERIEAIVGEPIGEFLIPEAARVLSPKPDGMDGVGIRFLIGEIAEPRRATLDECLYQYAAAELRRIGEALLAAADAVEGGVV